MAKSLRDRKIEREAYIEKQRDIYTDSERKGDRESQEVKKGKMHRDIQSDSDRKIERQIDKQQIYRQRGREREREGVRQKEIEFEK